MLRGLFLIKHVMRYISSYWMHISLFPKAVIKEIFVICRNFLWFGKSTGRMNLVACKVVFSGRDVGGLGCKELGLFNKTSILSQVWDLCLGNFQIVVFKSLHAEEERERPLYRKLVMFVYIS